MGQSRAIKYLKMFKKYSLGAELQPLRASPTVPRAVFLEAGAGGGWGQVQVEGWGVALNSLRPRYHALVFTVDVSQWRGTHRFCFVNILFFVL